MNKMMKFLKIGLMALFLALFIAPGISFADDVGGSGDNSGVTTTVQSGGSDIKPSALDTVDSAKSKDIFTILQKKLYNTLIDLRKIVYVIAGFGLIVFAVAAIFNKISYKHLGYIMVGLSLLSLMFPFLEYFSGYSIEQENQRKLVFENYLAASNYSAIRGTLDSDILNPKGEGQSGVSGEGEDEQSMLEKMGYGYEEVVEEEVDEWPISTIQKLSAAGCSVESSSSKSAWNEQTMTRNVCSVNDKGDVTITQETCQGKLKNGTCKKTTGQTLQDIWNTTANTIQFGLNAGAAFNNTVGSIIDTGAGIQNMSDVWNSDMGFFDKINALSNLTANTWGSNGAVTRDLNGIIGSLMNMGGNVSNTAGTWSTNYENNPSGTNPVSDYINMLGGYGQTASQYISQGGGYVSSGSHMGNEIHTQANNINAMLERFGGNGGSLWDRWRNVFGKK